jgi:UDP-glucose 4-epimerase
MDFIFSEDVARANILAMQSDVKDDVFNVGSGIETSLYELLQCLLKVTGHSGVEPEYMPERSVNPVPRRLSCTINAQEKIGFVAGVGLEEGLRRLVEWRRKSMSAGTIDAYVKDLAKELR